MTNFYIHIQTIQDCDTVTQLQDNGMTEILIELCYQVYGLIQAINNAINIDAGNERTRWKKRQSRAYRKEGD